MNETRRDVGLPALPQAFDLDEARERQLAAQISGQADEIEDTLRTYAPAPKPAMEPMPEYVDPRPNVPPVGALSAEAIVRDFEKTAKGIEAMAAELTEASNRCMAEFADLGNRLGRMFDDISSTVEHIKETAAMYREEAKLVFVRIEDTTLKMQEVREMSDQMRDRLTTPATNDPRLPIVQYAHGHGTRPNDTEGEPDGNQPQ